VKIDKKVCVCCKTQITDGKEYICTECYNKSLEELKDNELYQEIKKIDDHGWVMGVVIMWALFGNKGENK
jgi:hypothetical protein